MQTVHVGRYAIGEVLGRGAIGEVRAGLDLHTGHPVAIKLLTNETARSKEAGAAFAREVRAVARLNHPAVVAIYDQGRLDPEQAEALERPPDSPWFAMERAEYSAQRAIRDWGALRALLLDLLDGLAYCHARGLVHRDLKPGNVLRSEGRWKLADFGLAAPIDDLGDRIAGTPMYMAPEQFERPRDVGPWSDLYALGCVTWARCTGIPPYLGDVRALHRAHTEEPLPEFEGQFDLPPRFQLWLHRLLAKDPSKRFQHAADARAALPDGPSGWDFEDSPSATDRPKGTALIGMRELPLVGRDTERSALLDWIGSTIEQRQRSLRVVEGVAGTGKSYLAAQVAYRAAERGDVRLLEVRHDADDVGGDGLADFAERLLQRPRNPLTDATRRILSAWVDFRSPTPPWDDRLAALLEAVETLNASRPTLLLVDDLQWGPETQQFVERLLEVGPRPLALLATERIEPPAGSVLPEAWPRIRLGGLSPETAERLAAEVLGADSFRAMQLAELSRGSPLLAVQMAVHFAQTGRFAVQADPLQAWRTRLDSVLDAHPELWPALLVGAVLGGEVLDREYALLSSDGDQGGLDGLVRACLAEQTASGWRLAHPLLAEAVKLRASEAVWVRLNTTAAVTLRDADPLRRARLFLAAGEQADALELALHVHTEAHDAGDFGRRNRAWDVARQCTAPHGSLGLRRDIAGLLQGLGAMTPDEALSEATALVDRAVLADDLGEAEDRDVARAWRVLAVVRIRRAEFDAAADALDAAERRAPDDPANPDARLQLLLRAGRFAEAQAFVLRTGPPGKDARRIDRAIWNRSVGRVAFGLEAFERAERHLSLALELATDAGAPGLANTVRAELGEVVRWLGRPEESVAILQEVVRIDQRSPMVGPVARLNLALAMIEAGSPQRASAVLDELEDASGVWSELSPIVFASWARCLAELGRLEEVPAILARIDRPSHDPDYVRQLEALGPMCLYEPTLYDRVEALLKEARS
jgi:tetratricopeptide (TPR) repeat protein